MDPLPNPLKSLYDDAYWHEKYIRDIDYVSDRRPKISIEEKEIITQVQLLLPDNLEEAISIMNTAISDESSMAMIMVLGNLHFLRDNFKQAKYYFTKVANNYPHFLLNQKTLAYLLVSMEEYEEAIIYLNNSITLGNSEGRAFGFLGFCYLMQENYIAAEQAYSKAMIIEPQEKSWKLQLAQIYLHQERYKESNSIFQELLKLYPEEPEYWLLQSNGFLALGNIENAAANIEILKRMDKAPADSLLLLGDIYINLQMLELAFDAYTASVVKDPEQKIDFPIRAVRSLINYGAYDEAASLVYKIRRLYSGRTSDDDELTLLTMQSQVAIARGEGEKAKATLEKIIERDPKRGRAMLILGNFYGREGNSKRAVKIFDQAKTLDDFKAEALVAHAQLLAKSKEYVEAAELLREAQSIDFKDSVEDFLKKVEHIILVIEATSY